MVTINELRDHKKDDRLLYHYTNYSIAIENILNENTILFNRVNRTNDPLEFENFIHIASWSNEKEKSVMFDLLEIGKTCNDIVKNKFKICCFCIDKDIEDFNDYTSYTNKGYCRSRMWSQYGNGHKGVCLIFNKDRLLEIIKNNFKNVFAGEVHYKNNLSYLLDVTDIDYDIDRKMKPFERVIKYINEYLFHKFADYKSEQEFRIALHSDDNNDSILIDFENSLEGIILGVRFPEVYKDNIVNDMSTRKLLVFQLSFINGEYYIDEIAK